MINYDCPCGKKLQIATAAAGQARTCPGCGTTFTVPTKPPRTALERQVLRGWLYLFGGFSLFVAIVTYFDTHGQGPSPLAPAWISFMIALGSLAISAPAGDKPGPLPPA